MVQGPGGPALEALSLYLLGHEVVVMGRAGAWSLGGGSVSGWRHMGSWVTAIYPHSGNISVFQQQELLCQRDWLIVALHPQCTC